MIKANTESRLFQIIGEDPLNTGIYMVQLVWSGLDGEEHTWKPVEVMLEDIPKFLLRNLKQIRGI